MANIDNIAPQKFEEYVGQEDAKNVLKFIIDSFEQKINKTIKEEGYAASAEIFAPSILIIGQPGMGKTRLANIYINEMLSLSEKNKWPLFKEKGVQEWNCKGLPDKPFKFSHIEGSNIKDEDILDYYLYYIQIHGVLFIDEFQSIPKKIHDNFLRIMHEGEYFSGIADRVVKRKGFTIIGATTDESKISRAFRERFKYIIQLQKYDKEEQVRIVIYIADKMGLSINLHAAEVIAKRSRNNPRNIVQIMETLELMNINDKSVSVKEALEATKLRGIGPYGLTKRDVRVLEALNKHGRIGAETLSDMIGFNTSDNYRVWERFLIEEEYLLPQAGGRNITQKGKNVLKEINFGN